MDRIKSGAAKRYVTIEATISGIVNVVMTAAVAYLTFDLTKGIALAGKGGLLFDLTLQTFMVTLMTVLMGTILTRKRRKSGLQIGEATQATHSWPRNPLIRALVVALAAVVCFSPLLWLGLPLVTPPIWEMPIALLFKCVYAVALTVIIAPYWLRIAIAEQL